MTLSNVLVLCALWLGSLTVVAVTVAIPIVWIAGLPAARRGWCIVFGCKRQER